jgi:sugar phosphate isomerase/epimerase
MTLLLTLTTGSVQTLLKGHSPADWHTVPAMAMEQLGLRGLNIDASLLGGWSTRDMDDLRDRADKAACPCLALVDRTLLTFGGEDASAEAGQDRIARLAAAADRLGCNAISVVVSVAENDDARSAAIEHIREAMTAVEVCELNLLLAKGEGCASTADGLIDLVKQIGGFRIGVLPVFGDGDDPVDHLRRLAPYAGAVHIRVEGFSSRGKHMGADLSQAIATLRRVGYQNTVAIEFVGETKAQVTIEKARDQLQQAIDAELSE